ncbi:hypothetical protein [Intrasporangium mesophilum]
MRDVRLEPRPTPRPARHDQPTAHRLDALGEAAQFGARRVRSTDPVVLDDCRDQAGFGWDC